MSVSADKFYIDDLTGDLYLHENGAWALKGTVKAGGGGGSGSGPPDESTVIPGGGSTGEVTGPSVAVDGTPAVFNGVSGKVIKNISFSAFKTSLALTQSDVGLGNVDNTSDANKPVSTATQAEFASLTKASVGLANVDNTSDTAKPISTATQTALDAKVAGPVSVTDGLPVLFDGVTGKLIKSVAFTDFKTSLSLVKADVGLSNVDNTSDATKNAASVALTNHAFDASLNTLSKLDTTMFATNVIDTDVALTANSNTRLPTQAAVKAAINALLGANDAEVYKGVIDCSVNPNYPAADAGFVYRVSVAGKIGGASGINVEVSDRLQCIVDGTAAGNQATVGANWWITQANIDGAVVGPASAVDATPAVYDGTTGKLIKNVSYSTFKTSLALVKGDVGLGNVVNLDTSTQANVSFTGLSAAAAAADADTIPVNQGAGNLKQTFTAIKTWIKGWIVKADVGLGNVDNTSDATKNSAAVTLANKVMDFANNTISNITLAMFATNVADTDGTLAANSDTRVATQKATKTAIAASVKTVVAFRADFGGTPNTISTTGTITFKTVPFNNKVFEVGGSHYNPSTFQWTPPAGVVALSAVIATASPIAYTSSNYVLPAIFKNGVRITEGIQQGNATTNDPTGTGVLVVDLANGTDVYDVRAVVQATGTIILDGVVCFFGGYVVN